MGARIHRLAGLPAAGDGQKEWRNWSPPIRRSSERGLSYRPTSGGRRKRLVDEKEGCEMDRGWGGGFMVVGGKLLYGNDAGG